jgi:ABC-type transport system involved in multi-copper enzyme maturation permease subunit
MKLPPLVERELRAQARWPGFFWLRGLLAVAAGFQGYELLDRYALAPGNLSAGFAGGPVTVVSGLTLLRQMSWLLFAATLLMALLSADSISRERREGTLGLLLLTGLTPSQIVHAKMLSCGLTSFAVLLGCLPALMLPVLAGGVSGAEAAMTGIGLLNTLFVALAAGLWVSARFRERRIAILATLGLLAALTVGAQILGGAIFGPHASSALRIFGLAGWMTAARRPFLFNPLFLFWFALMQAVGWLFLTRSATALAGNWQDEPQKHFREPELTDGWAAGGQAESGETAAAKAIAAEAPLRASWLTNPRPWDADPVRWRAEQMGPMAGVVWLAVGLDFLAQFGVLGSIFNPGDVSAGSWGLLSFFGIVVILFSGALLASAGARFFGRSRREQDLELLLTTPVGCRNILAGQWHVLVQALVWPLGVVLAVGLPSGICLIYDWTHGNYREAWSSLPPLLIAVNLTLEVVAVCWVAMYLGLRGRNIMTTAAWTVGLAELLPMALAIGLMVCWNRLTAHAPGAALWRGENRTEVLALLFFLAKNAALIAWARRGLHRDLRLEDDADSKVKIAVVAQVPLPNC